MQSRMDCRVGRECHVWSKHSSELSVFETLQQDNNSHQRKRVDQLFFFSFLRQASVIHSKLGDDRHGGKKKPNQKTIALCICLLSVWFSVKQCICTKAIS